MTCEREHDCLLHLWGEMPPEQATAFKEHLAQCPSCKEQIQQFEPLVRSMQEIKTQDLPEETAQRIRTRLNHSLAAEPSRLRIRPRRVLAVAASILLILGVGVLWRLLLNGTEPLEDSTGDYVEAGAIGTLTENDYVEAFALVWISGPEQIDQTLNVSDDGLTLELEEVATGIESLLQEVESELSPADSDNDSDDTEGLRSWAHDRRFAT